MTWVQPPVGRYGPVELIPLTADLLDADTAAYRASPRAIAAHSGGRWPDARTFTEADNAPLIADHEREHAAGEAFAYALFGEAREIGCAYLRPHGDAARLTFWLVDDASCRPTATEVLAALSRWCGLGRCAGAVAVLAGGGRDGRCRGDPQVGGCVRHRPLPMVVRQRMTGAQRYGPGGR